MKKVEIKTSIEEEEPNAVIKNKEPNQPNQPIQPNQNTTLKSSK